MGLLLHVQVKHRNADPFLKHRKIRDAAFDSPFPIAMKINGASALPTKMAKSRGVSGYFSLFFLTTNVKIMKSSLPPSKCKHGNCCPSKHITERATVPPLNNV